MAHPWRDLLHGALRARARPVLVLPDATTTGASLWNASRLWVAWLRDRGLGQGERVVIAAQPSAGVVALLVACLWEGLTIAMAPPVRDGAEAAALGEQLDARCVLVPASLDACAHAVRSDGAGCPSDDAARVAPRIAQLPATPTARLLLRTSGSSGMPRWIALSDTNLRAVLASHRGALPGADARVLSVLPWHHAFGLVLDLLPALLEAELIVREPSHGRDATSMAQAMDRWQIDHASMVPLQVRRMLDVPEGASLLAALRGGIVGGAAVDADLAAALATTRLRAGYGQTEASPGIALGAPGVWRAGALGQATGCEARIDRAGVLHVRGENVCLGVWRPGAGLEVADARRWLDTGDVVRREHDGLLTFLGRRDHAFKLSNGRSVPTALIEQRLREASPEVVDAAVIPAPGHDGMVVHLLVRGPMMNGVALVHAAAGSLRGHVRGVVVRREGGVCRTPKGEVDRARLAVA